MVLLNNFTLKSFPTLYILIHRACLFTETNLNPTVIPRVVQNMVLYSIEERAPGYDRI